ncbi:exopolysaccharide biosynthesis protein [Mesoterricola sediminis]|uniref:Exopolysaccharide biosynthesis protein n=1 Tax=Mesoterricola sediminis TaxID=2927980 RepID=A0AA48H8Y0_9BACT|nr:exopolysaccharide biosynthesis protein [Mesoterricola sediminis]BDU78103.1 hypothetical protein METESE_30610 [Mesoterricola sediminis]
MAPRPFFSVLHELLDSKPEVTLEDLLAVAGPRTYGLLVLVLSLPSLVPGLNLGLAPVGGTAVAALGLQLAWGADRPWIPRRLRRLPLHKSGLKDGLARVEGVLDRFASRAVLPMPVNARGTGALVAWTGLLLAIPVPLPFGNILPAAVLCLLGAAILEERPAWAWVALAAAAANTVYFLGSANLILKAIHRLVAF